MLLDVAHGLAQALGSLAWMAQDVEREALGTLGANTWQLLKLVDESGEGLGKGHRAISSQRRFAKPTPNPQQTRSESGFWPLGISALTGASSQQPR